MLIEVSFVITLCQFEVETKFKQTARLLRVPDCKGNLCLIKKRLKFN